MTAFFYNLLILVTSIVPGHFVWVSIIVITILLRLAFLKPTISMTKMQHKQKALQGRLNALKEKHKGDKQAEQRATMDLYKQEGVNPLGSCLPMIVQLVVLIGFYGIFTRIGLAGGVKTNLLYSFTPHLQSINSSFLGIDLTQKVMVIAKNGGWQSVVAWALPILTAGTQLIQSLQTKALQPQTNPGDQSAAFSKALNNQFIFLFPVMAAYISYTLPAALSLYWITQTVFMVFQQKIVLERLHTTEVIAEEVAEVTHQKVESYNKGGVVVTVKEKE
ncbi:MAG: YidC/Oxa1 family membrane protein insertase [Candidatus Berkelbacteria bacterium]|nr:YidC/Oxa1 family membrane protein insertase [Candidatus Berkelbacteria bacterium]